MKIYVLQKDIEEEFKGRCTMPERHIVLGVSFSRKKLIEEIKNDFLSQFDEKEYNSPDLVNDLGGLYFVDYNFDDFSLSYTIQEFKLI